MPSWSEDSEIARDTEIFKKLCLAILGLYTWEIIVQLPFDWNIISRKREAQWPSIFHFFCKYSLWFNIIGVNVATTVTAEINYQALHLFNQFTAHIAIGSASTLLLLRTIAVWNRAPLITAPLIVASLGQWCLLLIAIATTRSSWSDIANAYVVEEAPPVFLKLIYLYTMSFDLILLVVTTVGLIASSNPFSLWQLVFPQGIIYFLTAFIANLVPTIFLILNLHPIMNIMFTIPATAASSIAACRSFASLTNIRQRDLYVHSTIQYSTPHVGAGGGSGGDVIQARAGGTTKGVNDMGFAFGDISTDADSIDQAYSMSTIDITRTASTLAATDSRYEYDFGASVDAGDLERVGGSLSHGRKSHVRDV